MFKKIIEPRISETDGMRHINNTTIPVWLEGSRNELFDLFNPSRQFEDWTLLLVNTNINYKGEIFFGEDVEVRCWIKRIGNSSIVLYEEIWQMGRLCVDAETTYVNVDSESKKPMNVSDDIRDALQSHMLGERKESE